MHNHKIFRLLSIPLFCFALFASCNQKYKSDNFTAFFGGEVTNPQNRYVLFLKDNEVIDTLPLDRNNRFYKKFDSLTPGLYTFKHEPEYQYVYFDKNDSIMVRMNSADFDESVIFCGRGGEKNNFLMEMYLQNDADRSKMFSVFDYNVAKFTHYIDSAYAKRKNFYQTKKEKIQWNDEFDFYAQAALTFPYYTRKEIYPVVHELRTGEKISEKLPADFYNFRKEIDFNNQLLTHYSPFVKYLTYLLNNLALEKTALEFSARKANSLEMNIAKLNIADTLFTNPSIKNTVLDNIAFAYLLEDQEIENNKKFLERYSQLSTDKSNKNEISKIGNAIKNLKPGNSLPELELINPEGEIVKSSEILTQKTVIFFWTENAESHLVGIHKKAIEFQKRFPQYQFIGINVDDNQAKWKNEMAKYHLQNIREYRIKDFESLREKWVITKIQRAIITDDNGKIKDAFVNLFDVNFEKLL